MDTAQHRYSRHVGAWIRFVASAIAAGNDDEEACKIADLLVARLADRIEVESTKPTYDQLERGLRDAAKSLREIGQGSGNSAWVSAKSFEGYKRAIRALGYEGDGRVEPPPGC